MAMASHPRDISLRCQIEKDGKKSRKEMKVLVAVEVRRRNAHGAHGVNLREELCEELPFVDEAAQEPARELSAPE
jgi:hypothetical protein